MRAPFLSRRLPLLSSIPLLLALTADTGAGADQPRPIPDIATLIQQVQIHQRELDKTRENYMYRERVTINELDKSGNTKKVERRESEIFFVNAHPIERLVGKDGQTLSPSEQAKQSEHVKKEIEKAEHTPPGSAIDERGSVSVARLLSIEKFTNPRRIEMDKRSVLAFDFAGDRSARTHGPAESASKDLVGTIWIDEQDREVRRVVATLHDNFHMGFGLFALSKGSSFSFDQKLVNGELWLPTSATAHVEAHAAVFIGFRANVQIVDDNYQRFHTDSQQQSGVSIAH